MAFFQVTAFENMAVKQATSIVDCLTYSLPFPFVFLVVLN